ncbi:MAG: glycosyltransferase family 4 protein [Desulfovibrio sp.]|nr:glycosyltransferase family 4 protein [Desulfovibrio sp.]
MPHPAPHGHKTKVACILLWYPLFTQPFIFREVEGLRLHTDLVVHTLYGPNLTHCSEEMRSVASSVHTLGVKALGRVLFELIRQIVSNPRRFFSLCRRHMLQRWPSLEIFGENLWAFCAGFVLAKRLKEQNIEIIYAPWPRGTAQAAWLVQELTGIPFAMTVRGDNLKPADPDLLQKMSACSLIRANNRADQIRIEQLGQKAAVGKTALVYNSLTLPASALNKQGDSREKDGPCRLMALGRFDVTKGFDVLLKACGLLRSFGLDFRLTLAGGGGLAMGLGGLEGQLRKLCAELELNSFVSFPGLISHDELPSLLLAHDIFVAPCVVDPMGRQDGIPNTVIEAMSMGLPIVASNINALPEVVRHEETGLAVPANDPKALAQAIQRLALDPQLRKRLGSQAAKLARELFDPQKNCQTLAQLLVAHVQRKKPCAE